MVDDGRNTGSPLAGVRVLELGSAMSAAFAAKWLAALGADVLKLEPPEGDPARAAGPFPGDAPDPEASGRFLYLNTAKRSAIGDPERAATLAGETDILIDSTPPGAAGLDVDALIAQRRGLVVVSITPFGRSGPHAELPAQPLTVAARSGLLWHAGPPGRAPLMQGGSQPEYLAGLHGFAAALAGHHAAQQTGRSLHFDVSVQACAAAVAGHFTGRATQVGQQLGRIPPRAMWRLYAVRDGWAGICALPRNYARLAEVMDLPELTRLNPFLDPTAHAEEERRTTELLSDWFGKRERAEIDGLAHEFSVPLACVMAVDDVLASEQLAHRGFFAEEDHPRAGPLRYPGQLWSGSQMSWVREAAPTLGSSAPEFAPRPAAPPNPGPSSTALPLTGVRVLDLGQIWAGPYAAMLLADQGADVIKVESATAWDPNRCAVPPPAGRDTDWWNTCAYFHEYNRNKRSIGLDVRHPQGQELFGRLVEQSDVVIENFRADVLDRLGIGYDWLQRRNPEIVLVSMAGFGKAGPEAHLPGYGPIIEQRSGLAAMTGYTDGHPQLVEYAYGDPVAAVTASAAALAALIARRRTGRGQHVDLSQRDVVTALLGESFMDWSMNRRRASPMGNGDPRMSPHGVYPCVGEDQWVAIAVASTEQWEGLRDAMGRPAWADDPALVDARERARRRAELDERVGAWTRLLDKREVFERCRRAGVAAGPVWDDDELLADAQLAARGFYESIEHPAMGSWWTHGWVWRRPGDCVRNRAPDFGEHNRQILSELLSIDDERRAALERDGVVASRPVGIPEL